MTLLEKLSDLRKLSINNLEVIDLLTTYIEKNDHFIGGAHLKYVIISSFEHGMFISNINYNCCINFLASKFIIVDKYGIFGNGVDEDELNQITVEDIFYPTVIPLFDILLDVNDYIDGMISMEIMRRYVYFTKLYHFENEMVKVASVIDNQQNVLTYGYIVSNYFIILFENDFRYSKVKSSIFVSDGDIPELTDEGFREFMSKHKSKITDEQLTFRQFIGINNVKSARNF